MTKNFYIAAFVVSMLAFSSCKIGKRYVRPELNLPDRIEAYTDTTDTASGDDRRQADLFREYAAGGGSECLCAKGTLELWRG